jgi:uncharacterized membrane protein YphA (DoxX/SURF4 family)
VHEKKGLGLLWDAVLGMTIAAGVFTRFTYLFFFMPVGLAYLLFHSRSGLWPAQRTPSLVHDHTRARGHSSWLGLIIAMQRGIGSWAVRWRCSVGCA